jgi:WhiB family redox-sensing transcriptional regulator
MSEPRSLRETLAWQERALCLQADPEVFYIPGRVAERDAKAVCAACEVRPECLDRALDTGEPHGVWGGYTEQERRHMARTKTARRLGTCAECGRQRYSNRYPGQILPTGAVWNGNNHSRSRKLCQECRAAAEDAKNGDPA